jgi:hypothetical protein
VPSFILRLLLYHIFGSSTGVNLQRAVTSNTRRFHFCDYSVSLSSIFQAQESPYAAYGHMQTMFQLFSPLGLLHTPSVGSRQRALWQFLGVMLDTKLATSSGGNMFPFFFLVLEHVLTNCCAACICTLLSIFSAHLPGDLLPVHMSSTLKYVTDTNRRPVTTSELPAP